MKLVSSNEAAVVQDTVRQAVKHYRDKSDVAGAVDILTRLKGIGPATASLLLAVHDADKVVFFADEAFYWLCCDGAKAPIKYNLKEYRELNERAQALAKRLGVRAVDVERVAFVLMRREPPGDAAASTAKPPTGPPAERTGKTQAPKPAKRKASGGDPVTEPPVRRSKRGKQA
jgi:hypothetical protein